VIIPLTCGSARLQEPAPVSLGPALCRCRSGRDLPVRLGPRPGTGAIRLAVRTRPLLPHRRQEDARR
jgi:hypothetical protein